MSCAKPQEETQKLRLQNFVWSAYTWHWNDTTKQNQFYLGHYLEIKPNGECFIMRHDTFMGQPTFYQTKLPDTLLVQLNAAFAKGIDSTNFRQSQADSVIDGYISHHQIFYCFDYSTSTGKPQFFKYYAKFLGNYLPENLVPIHHQLNTVTYQPKLVKLEERPASVLYDHYAVQLKEKLNDKVVPVYERSSKDVIYIPPPPIEE